MRMIKKKSTPQSHYYLDTMTEKMTMKKVREVDPDSDNISLDSLHIRVLERCVTKYQPPDRSVFSLICFGSSVTLHHYWITIFTCWSVIPFLSLLNVTSMTGRPTPASGSWSSPPGSPSSASPTSSGSKTSQRSPRKSLTEKSLCYPMIGNEIGEQ